MLIRGARPSRRNVESDPTATLNQPDDEDDQRQHQQDVKQSTHRVGSEQAHYPQHQEKHRQGPQHCATSLSRRDKLPCRSMSMTPIGESSEKVFASRNRFSSPTLTIMAPVKGWIIVAGPTQRGQCRVLPHREVERSSRRIAP
jgi:hypothetical protein